MRLVRQCRTPLVVGSLFASPLTPAGASGQEPAGDSVVYLLAPASRFDVKTGKAGLFGFAGHAHVIRARALSGRVVYYPGAPASSHVEIMAPADSLEVITPRSEEHTSELQSLT